MPRFLGMFETPHAGFVEVFDREDGGKDLYLTTFNPALPFFHDPVFFLRDPGIVSHYIIIIKQNISYIDVGHLLGVLDMIEFLVVGCRGLSSEPTTDLLF